MTIRNIIAIIVGGVSGLIAFLQNQNIAPAIVFLATTLIVCVTYVLITRIKNNAEITKQKTQSDENIKITQIIADAYNNETHRKYDYAEKTLEYKPMPPDQVPPNTIDFNGFFNYKLKQAAHLQKEMNNNQSSAQKNTDTSKSVKEKPKIMKFIPKEQ